MLNNLHRTKNSPTSRKTSWQFVFQDIIWSLAIKVFAADRRQCKHLAVFLKKITMNKWISKLICDLVFCSFLISFSQTVSSASCKLVVISYRIRNIYILTFKSAGNGLWRSSLPAQKKKINFKKQAAIRKQEIKKNEITKGIRKYASHGEQFLNKRCLETLAISASKKNSLPTAVIFVQKPS